MLARLKRIHSLSSLREKRLLYYVSLKLVVDMDTWGVHGFQWPYCGPVSSQFMFSSQPDSCLLLCLPVFSTIFLLETSSSLLVGSKYWFGILSMQKEWKNFHQRPRKHFPIDIFWAEWKAAQRMTRPRDAVEIPEGSIETAAVTCVILFLLFSSIFLIHI